MSSVRFSPVAPSAIRIIYTIFKLQGLSIELIFLKMLFFIEKSSKSIIVNPQTSCYCMTFDNILSPIMSALRGQRSNAPFTEEQETWIILEYGALRNYLQVRRKFRLHYKLSPAKVPGICAFQRLIRWSSCPHYK